MKKRGVIVSALGKQTFTHEQIERLESCLDAIFHPQIDPVSKEEWIELAKPAEILAVTRRPIKNIDAEMISALPALRGLAIYSTGYEWVELAALRERGILLSYLPDYSAISVAEHTLGVLLAMARRIHLTYDKSRGMVPDWVSLRGMELRGKRLGLVGLGTIGREVARLAACFGMEVCFYDIREVNQPNAIDLSWEELLQTSDFIVLMCSKERGAEPIIGARELAMMKQGVYLVNTARADLVESGALLDAIRAKHVMGYAVDDTLPIFQDPTIEPGRILQTGHTAWYSTEAIQRGTEAWVNNIVGLALDQPIHLV